MAGIVYDPNHPDILHRAWEDAVNIGDKSANGWVFLNDEREVLDMIVTDADGEWVFGEPPNITGRTGWDAVIDHARSLGATDIINVHHHTNDDEVAGPCDGLAEFASETVLALATANLTLRAVLVCSVDRLDGVMQVATQNDSSVESRLLTGVVLRKTFRDKPDISDTERALIIEAIDHSLDVIAGVEAPNPTLLARAAELATDRLADKLPFEPTPAPKSDPFSLPSINVSDIKYMN